MKDNYIQLKDYEDILVLPIKTSKGEDTGNYLEFDLEDVEVPLKYQDMIEKDKKNREYLKNQIFIIDKRQDVKGKKILSKNQEDRIKAVIDFFKKEKEVYDMFLGEGGVDKILNGRKFHWDTLQEISEIIDQQIAPKLDISMKKISEKIKNKYKQIDNQDEEEIEVLK